MNSRLDGTSADVAYRSMVVRDVAPDVLWFEDSEGTIYGTIGDGVWEYEYDFLGDLDLRSARLPVRSVRCHPAQNRRHAF